MKLLFLASLGNEVYPGFEVGTAKREDGFFYVNDFGTETNDSKGTFGHHRNELWNMDKKNESCGMSI